jgi:hypothetical protein
LTPLAFLSNANVNIKLVSDIVLGNSVSVSKGNTVNLDLNGKTISQEYQQVKAYAMISNEGTLTIKDEEGSGKISYKDIAVYSSDNNWVSNTITNKGVLNVESGTIENTSSDNVMTFGYPHAIDAYPGSTTNINGGTIKSENYDCIRMYCSNVSLSTIVNINGGNIINRVTFHNTSANIAGSGALNINGGTFTVTGNVNANVRLLNFSSDVSNMKAVISGGTFDKGVKTQNYGSWESNWDWIEIKDGVNVNKL